MYSCPCLCFPRVALAQVRQQHIKQSGSLKWFVGGFTGHIESPREICSLFLSVATLLCCKLGAILEESSPSVSSRERGKTGAARINSGMKRKREREGALGNNQKSPLDDFSND